VILQRPSCCKVLEPNIAFSVEERTADRVRIRIYFSLESLPPWLQNAEVSGPLEYFVRLEVSAGKRQRSAAPTDTVCCVATWRYVRPEKQTVEDQRRSPRLLPTL
jgi:hypothetical protein